MTAGDSDKCPGCKASEGEVNKVYCERRWQLVIVMSPQCTGETGGEIVGCTMYSDQRWQLVIVIRIQWIGVTAGGSKGCTTYGDQQWRTQCRGATPGEAGGVRWSDDRSTRKCTRYLHTHRSNNRVGIYSRKGTGDAMRDSWWGMYYTYREPTAVGECILWRNNNCWRMFSIWEQ